MADKIVRTFGPAAMAASATNVYHNSTSTIYDVLLHIHVVNTSTSAQTFSLYVNATTGTESAATALFVNQAIGANDVYDWYGKLRLDSTDFLVGHASATSVTIMGEGTKGVV